MKILRIATSGFRGLPDTTFELGDRNTGRAFDVVYVTGPAGAGKTSFLEAIVAAKENVAPYGPPVAQDDYVRAGESAAKVTVDWLLDDPERARCGASSNVVPTESIFSNRFVPPARHDAAIVSVLGDYSTHSALGKVEYFHASRRLPRGSHASAIAGTAVPSIARAQRLGRDDAKYGALEAFAVHAALGLDEGDPNDRHSERATAVRLAAAFASLCSTKRLDGVQRVEGAIVARFVDGAGRAYRVDQLSEHEKQAFLFAGTFVRHGVHGSLVLVDTPELHFGGADARAFVTALARLGSDNQLVVATGSQEVLAGVPAAQVIRLPGSRA